MKINLVWLRRDLRIHDNAALYHALRSGKKVQCVFIFDQYILSELHESDARVAFIHRTLMELNDYLVNLGSSLCVKHGKPQEVWKELLDIYDVEEVYTNSDYEHYAIKRDFEISQLLHKNKIKIHSFKDHVIFDGSEILKSDGKPYTVFTPYMKKWMEKIRTKKNGLFNFYLASYPTEKYFHQFYTSTTSTLPTMESMGFVSSKFEFPNIKVAQSVIANYDKKRDFPAMDATSKLGIHFRFGTISIREKARKAMKLNQTYLSELIWRDFYAMILYHFPEVEHQSFRKEYDRIIWLNEEQDFEKWKNGKTGFPLVDAGMRQLNSTGYMHNRVRMITASFLTKHLLIDWRWGEAYFAEKLLDFDLASNNGGWQWAAGCGTDAAPYFRVFNPTLQQQKFDPEYDYVKKWVPEFGSNEYVQPMVDHAYARERCLTTYKKALKK